MSKKKLSMKELKEVQGGAKEKFERFERSAMTDLPKDENPGQQDNFFQKVIDFFELKFN